VTTSVTDRRQEDDAKVHT